MRSPALRLLPVLLIAVLAAPAPSAVAWHDDDTPLLHSGEVDHPIWISYLFDTDGAKVVADMEGYQMRPPLQLGAVLYDHKERAIFAFTSFFLPGHRGVYLDANPAPGYNVHVDMTEPDPEKELVGLALHMNDPERGDEPVTGRFKLLMWATGSAQRVVHSLRGETGSACVNTDTGTNASVYTSKDFTGPANVQAGVLGVGARATVDVRRTVEARDTLVGVYFSDLVSRDDISVETPSGPESCPCFFFSFVPDDLGTPWGPGSYTFKDSGAGAGDGIPEHPGGEILLSVVDARLADPPAEPTETPCPSGAA